MDALLVTMLNQTCKLAPPASVDGYGKRTFGADVSVTCYVQYNRERRDGKPEGEVALPQGRIYAQPTTVTPEYRLTLPDGTVAPINGVHTLYDETGAAYATVIDFGRVQIRA